jgi:hypothetical protein
MPVELFIPALAGYLLGVATMAVFTLMEWRRANKAWQEAQAEWEQAHFRAEEAKQISAHNVVMFESFKAMVDAHNHREHLH